MIRDYWLVRSSPTSLQLLKINLKLIMYHDSAIAQEIKEINVIYETAIIYHLSDVVRGEKESNCVFNQTFAVHCYT